MTYKTLTICMLGVIAALGTLSASRGALTINATWDSSITSFSNAAAYQATINKALTAIEGTISNNITVKILFANMGTGLGQNATYEAGITYARYRLDLLNNQKLSANDIMALSTLPASVSPISGDTYVDLTTPLCRALGETVGGNMYSSYDSTVSVNLSICNPNRTGTQISGFYDLQAVVAHEVNEVLGIGGTGSQLGYSTNNQVGVLDLFRFDGTNSRSFTTNSIASSYFSINNGSNSIASFNQTALADYGDWGQLGFVQSAYAAPNTVANLASPEITALDIVGWDLVTVPEPSPIGFCVLGFFAVAGVGMRRKYAK